MHLLPLYLGASLRETSLTALQCHWNVRQRTISLNLALHEGRKIRAGSLLDSLESWSEETLLRLNEPKIQVWSYESPISQNALLQIA